MCVENGSLHPCQHDPKRQTGTSEVKSNGFGPELAGCPSRRARAQAIDRHFEI